MGVGPAGKFSIELHAEAVRISMHHRGSELLLRREMIVDARTLHAHIVRDVPEAESVEAAAAHSKLGRIHDRVSDSAHGTPPNYLSIGRYLIRDVKTSGLSIGR